MQFVKVYYYFLENFTITQALKLSIMLNFHFAKYQFFKRLFSKSSFYRLKNIIDALDIETIKKDKFFIVSLVFDFKQMKSELIKKIISFFGSKKKASKRFFISRNTLKVEERKNIKEGFYMEKTKNKKTKKATFFSKNEILQLQKVCDDWKIIANYMKHAEKYPKENIDFKTFLEFLEKNKDKSGPYIVGMLKNGAYWQYYNLKKEKSFLENYQKEDLKNDISEALQKELDKLIIRF